MKCPYCGAETKGTICEFCGSQISEEKPAKATCGKCGSSNITFRRENQGEIRGKNAKRIVHRTVGICKNCGNTWYEDEEESVPKKRKTWLWVLGWIFIFPLPLTLILLKKKEMKPALKYGIIAVAWIVYLVIAISARSSDSKAQGTQQAPSSSQISTSEASSTVKETNSQ
ncbi:MAG: hypothetical protein IKE62_02215 [Oscillospiraceae bacterium]|nr:hypothetical protein [Oscillospiraceae bacterium]